MKKIFLLAIGLFLCFTAFSQAEKAKYYIEGDYTITQGPNGQFVYQLSNISSQGIYFTPQNVIYGKKEADESISFTFDKATTDCSDGFASGLKFWKWQSNGKEYTWQRDSEVKDAQQDFETDKIMAVMLVLDCSNSLGNDNFERLKSSATKFINILYNASSDGSIRLGIIGFNTMGNADRMTREIEPLTADSRDQMIRFIQNMTLYNNTALYYAMHKASDMVVNYVGGLSAEESEKFDYACMVSFTDGYDNHSMDASIGVPQEGLDNPYFQYVSNQVVNRSVGNSNLKSYVIAIKGNDVAEDNKLYKAVFKGLSSDEPILLSDFSELENQFENMAQELIKRWQNLTCYVPSAHQGKVRWTIGNYTGTVKETPAPKEEPKAEEKRVSLPKKLFLGVHAGVGTEFTSTWYPFGLGVGFEFAVPVQKLAVGGLLALKYDLLGPTHIDLGGMAVFGDYVNKKAFILGAGLDLRCPTEIKNRPKDIWVGKGNDAFGAGFLLRLGLTIPNPSLYFFADFGMGGYKPAYWMRNVETNQMEIVHLSKFYMNVSLNVGYRFSSHR